MTKRIDLVENSDWVCDLLVDLRAMLTQAGFKHSSTAIDFCVETLQIEAVTLKAKSENAQQIESKSTGLAVPINQA